MSAETEALKSTIEGIKDSRRGLEDSLSARQNEARNLLRAEAATLLIDIYRDPTVLAEAFRIIRLRSSGKIVFEIQFSEGDLINRQDYAQTVKDINALVKVAEVDPIYKEEVR